MVVTVNIELGNDGTYGAYIAGDNPLGFGVIGEGNTVNEAKEDFLKLMANMCLKVWFSISVMMFLLSLLIIARDCLWQGWNALQVLHKVN